MGFEQLEIMSWTFQILAISLSYVYQGNIAFIFKSSNGPKTSPFPEFLRPHIIKDLNGPWEGQEN